MYEPNADIIIDGKKYACVNLMHKSSLMVRNMHV